MFRPSPDVIVNEFDGETVLLNLKTEEYFSLEKGAAEMYGLLVRYGDPKRVLPILQAGYDAEAEVLQRDLESLISDLVREGILLAGD